MMKKYSFTGLTELWCGITLYQIRAEISFGTVIKGDIGGYIKKEENLGHDGNAWVFGNARVFGDAQVFGDARVYGDAWVRGDALVSGNARVFGNAQVSGDARVFSNEQLYWISKIGSRNDTTTFFNSKFGIEVSCGCFSGTLMQFSEAVEKTHGDNKHGKAYKLAIEIAKLKLGDLE